VGTLALARRETNVPGGASAGGIETGEERAVLDVIYIGIPFVFLGLCLLYVRAAAKL
jgi:hypothetical protein